MGIPFNLVFIERGFVFVHLYEFPSIKTKTLKQTQPTNIIFKVKGNFHTRKMRTNALYKIDDVQKEPFKHNVTFEGKKKYKICT